MNGEEDKDDVEEARTDKKKEKRREKGEEKGRRGWRQGWLLGRASREGRADSVEEGEKGLVGKGLEDETEGEGEEDDADNRGVVPGRNERAGGVVAAVVEEVHGDVEVGLEPSGLVVSEIEEHSEHDRGKDLEALGSAGRVVAGVDVVFSGGDEEGFD